MRFKTLNNWIIKILDIRGQKLAMVYGEVDGKKIPLFIKYYDGENEAIVISDHLSYIIGEPNLEYESKYPNSRSKFIEALGKRNDATNNISDSKHKRLFL